MKNICDHLKPANEKKVRLSDIVHLNKLIKVNRLLVKISS